MKPFRVGIFAQSYAFKVPLRFVLFCVVLWLGNSFLFNGIIVRCLDELQLIDPFTY